MPKTSNTALLSNKAATVTKLSASAKPKPAATKHSFPLADWLSAKNEAREVMIEVSMIASTIRYIDLAERICSIRIAAHDPRLGFLLEEISIEEDKAGRGLLSAVVVHAEGDYMPGNGFFDLAARRGRNTNNHLACWIGELKYVHLQWQQ